MATIVQNIETLNTIKNDIKKAINDKGVTVTDSDSFTLYASKIDQIKQGEGGDSTNYSYYDGSIDEAGLKAIGWDDESIGYLRDNVPHFSWQNSDYIVSEENKAFGVIIDKTTLDANRTNPNLEYLPMMGALPSSQNMFFRGATYLKALPKIDTSLCTDTEHLFQDCSNLLVIPYIDTSNAKSMYAMFDGCYKLINIPLLNTSNVTSMNTMFYKCTSLKTIPPLNTINVSNMNRMFNSCSSLEIIPLLNTSNVTAMEYMFYDCTSLKTIPLLDTSNVTSMEYMFSYCSKLETIPLLKTSNVTAMEYMFGYCSKLKTIPLLDTSNVTDMNYMFYNCNSLETIPLLNTSNVNNMSNMFCGCSSLQSLPLLDVGKVTNMSNIFAYSNITTLTDLGGFKDLKIDWKDNYGLRLLPNLTYQSIINVINNLYDFRANGDETTTRTLKINSKTYALLSDEDIALASSKGWTISK